MRIAALDLGATFIGWAVGEESEIPRCGMIMPEDKEDLGAFACSYADWWAKFLSVEAPDAIAIEGGTPIQTIKKPAIAERMLAVLTMTMVICHRRKMPKPLLIPVGTVRRVVVGSGHCKDAEVMRAMVELGCRPTDEHAADACAVWMYKAGRKWRPARVAA